MTDNDFIRMNYIIDCSSNVILNGSDQLIYRAQSWSIHEDKFVDDQDSDIIDDYIISIDLSNSLFLKQFNNQTIQLTGFSFSLQSLSLARQSKYFQVESNAFSSILYQNLKILNLSSCCQHIPINCSQIFRPLKKLQILDLSGSDMYRSCLNTPDTISSTLRDLILRDNNYDTNTFSHSSRLFDGVRTINGKLDLQYSRFNMSIQLKGNCLFDLFNNITTLDLSFVQFYSVSNNIEIHLTHLLKCRTQINHQRHGKQLLNLYLRRLNLQQLPTWFNQDRFPRLTQLDLSYNKIYSIDLRTFTTLDSISLAYNPLEFDKLFFRSNFIYNSINLRSTIQNQTFNLKNRIERLFKLTTNLDYSENYGNIRNNITKFHINIDFSDQVSLNLSQTNIYSFEINDPSRLDDLFRLDLSLNYLIRLNLEKQSKLSYLDCSNQNLQTLILSRQYSRLIELKCSNNSLETIENFSLFEHENLKLIDLSYNSIKSLNILFSNLKSRYLHTINLKSNLIEKISSNMFHKKLISLYFIDLSSNQINSIQNYSFQSPNLQILDLTNNPLKDIEVKFISTSSLRLFYIVNHTQQLIDRCKKSKLYDNLLLIYIRWFEQNGTYMKSRSIKEINVDQCLIYYSLNNKNKWINIYNKYHIKNLSFYIIIIMIIIGIGIGIIYLYKKTRIEFFTRLQRYSPLDEHSLVDNVDDINHEDNEIVMNLSEVPFNVNVRS